MHKDTYALACMNRVYTSMVPKMSEYVDMKKQRSTDKKNYSKVLGNISNYFLNFLMQHPKFRVPFT